MDVLPKHFGNAVTLAAEVNIEVSTTQVFSAVGWLGSRVVSVLDSGAVGPGLKSQPRHFWVTVLCKLFTLIVPLFIRQ